METFQNAADPVFVWKLWYCIFVRMSGNRDFWKLWPRYPCSLPSSRPYHLTLFQKKTTNSLDWLLVVNYTWITWALLTLLLMLAADMRLKCAFDNATTCAGGKLLFEWLARIPVSSGVHWPTHAQRTWMVMCVFRRVWTEIISKTGLKRLCMEIWM